MTEPTKFPGIPSVVVEGVDTKIERLDHNLRELVHNCVSTLREEDRIDRNYQESMLSMHQLRIDELQKEARWLYGVLLAHLAAIGIIVIAVLILYLR